jgi:DNA-binding NtrC family response regulator
MLPRAPGDRKMKRILVVDNDAGVRQMLKVALQDLDFSVSTAESGNEALEIYRSQAIDFVLLDMRMPDMEGKKTLESLKSIDPGVICCFMSGSENITPDELARLGAVGFFQKPFSLEKVKQLILSHLGEDT